jgi:hypothetical protein
LKESIFNPSISHKDKKGRPFRLSKTEIIGTIEKKYINGEYKSCTRHTFKYLDKEQPRFFEIELDWNNKLINR